MQQKQKISHHEFYNNPIYIESKANLELLYKTRSQRQIGELYGISRTAVSNLFDKLQIKRKTYAESSSIINLWTFPGFTPSQEQLVYGSLLGDANLHRAKMISNKKSHNELIIYRLQFSHCKDQEQYLNHKWQILPGCKIHNVISGHGSLMYRYYFCHTPTLAKVAQLCHNQNHQKFVTQAWLNKLTWEGIAYWYQDDGFITSSHHRPFIGFCTDSFILKSMLSSRFGLDTKEKQQRPGQFRLISRYRDQIKPFIDHISPYVIESLNYKLYPQNDASVVL